MSNDGFAPPPDDDQTPPDGLAGIAGEPTQAMPLPGSLPPDATQVMPTVPPATPTPPPSYTTGPGGTPPPTPPPVAAAAPAAQPGPGSGKTAGIIGGVLAAVVLIAGGLIFFMSQGDDAADVLIDATGDSISLSVAYQDAATSTALVRSVAVSVTAAPTPTDFAWIAPVDAIAGEPALQTTDASGRAEFRWQPGSPGGELEPVGWSSTFAIVEAVDPAVTEIVGDCRLDRDGNVEPLVITTSIDETLGFVTTFPNLTFVVGDRIECTFGETTDEILVPVETTTPEPTTSLVPTTAPETSMTPVADQTTNVAPTTDAPTPVPPTTGAPDTTVAPTTEASTTVPTASDPTAATVLSERSDLSDAVALLDRVGLLDELAASSEPFTLFVPDNDAIQALRDASGDIDLDDDTQVRELLLGHVVTGEALTAAEIVGRDSLVVASGAPRVVDAATTPVRIGTGTLTETDIVVDGGVVHLLGTVIEPA